MICPNCGFQNAAGDEFCGSCGHFLAWEGSAPDDATTVSSPGGTQQPPPDAGPPLPAPPPDAVPPGGAAPQPGPPESTGLTPVPPPPGTYNAGAINWPAGLQRCDVCGTANELSRAFCLNCGARLKKAGTTTGTALAVAAADDERRRGMRMVGWVVLGACLFIVAAAGAFVVLGGLNPPASPGPATPPATLIAVNPSGSTLPVAPTSPPASGAAPATDQPLVTPPPASLEPPPSGVPATPVVTIPPASVPPATPPPAGGFVCAPSTLAASVPGKWQIFQAHWGRKGGADTLTLEMHPSTSSSAGGVGANLLPADQVQPTYGIAGPTNGSLALVLSYNDAVTLTGPFGAQIGFKALQEFHLTRKSGLVYAVIGVNGSGCYNLSSDAWTSGSSSSPEFVISLQR